MGVELNFSNQNHLQNYFLLGYIPAPLTMYQNTYKLKSGEVLEFNLNKLVEFLNLNLLTKI